MAEREQVRKPAHQDEEVVDEQAPEAATDLGDELKNEMDDLLDEIDGVLETNAEEFVKNYVQKGGE